MDHSHKSSQPIGLHGSRVGFWQKLGGTSLMIAVIIHAIAIVIGAVWIFQIISVPDHENHRDIIPLGRGDHQSDAKNAAERRNRNRSAPVTRVIALDPLAEINLPDLDKSFGKLADLPSLDVGGVSGNIVGGKNGSFVTGDGPAGFVTNVDSKLFKMVPPGMGKRCSKDDRLARLKENGGTRACEDAVLNGLRWLKANQKADGSFADGSHKVAMTGLALLAYFGHCETPASEEFGDSCLRGIVFLVNQGMKNDGRLATDYSGTAWCYEHAIATYALGEAYTFCKELKTGGFDIPNLRLMTEKAGQFIIDNQNDNGGWAYAYAKAGGHTDVSVVGWQIQALKACSHTGIPYHGMTTSITKGLKYVNDCQDKSGGYGYTSSAAGGGLDYHTLTGVGMLCNQIWGKGSRSEVNKAARYVLKNTRFEYNAEFCDLYGHYYESQAMMQRGGGDWKQYNDLFRDPLLNNQNADGSWKVPGGGKKVRAVAPAFVTDTTYRTCLCTLMLEVYYRFLSTGGGVKERDGIL